jgi:uncharacterized protein YdcH (DUF465 family)
LEIIKKLNNGNEKFLKIYNHKNSVTVEIKDKFAKRFSLKEPEWLFETLKELISKKENFDSIVSRLKEMLKKYKFFGKI